MRFDKQYWTVLAYHLPACTDKPGPEWGSFCYSSAITVGDTWPKTMIGNNRAGISDFYSPLVVMAPLHN